MLRSTENPFQSLPWTTTMMKTALMLSDCTRLCRSCHSVRHCLALLDKAAYASSQIVLGDTVVDLSSKYESVSFAAVLIQMTQTDQRIFSSRLNLFCTPVLFTCPSCFYWSHILYAKHSDMRYETPRSNAGQTIPCHQSQPDVRLVTIPQI